MQNKTQNENFNIVEIEEINKQRMENVKMVLERRYLPRRRQIIDIDFIKSQAPGSITLLDDPEKDVKIIALKK